MATDAAVREFSEATKELGDKIAEMTLKEAKELSDYLEDVHEIKAAAGGGVMAVVPTGVGETAEGPEEPTEFDVILDSFGEKKISVIKVVRANTGLGLKEAKDLVEGCPNAIKEGLSKEDAEKLKTDLEEAGATVSIK